MFLLILKIVSLTAAALLIICEFCWNWQKYMAPPSSKRIEKYREIVKEYDDVVKQKKNEGIE